MGDVSGDACVGWNYFVGREGVDLSWRYFEDGYFVVSCVHENFL